MSSSLAVQLHVSLSGLRGFRGLSELEAALLYGKVEKMAALWELILQGQR